VLDESPWQLLRQCGDGVELIRFRGRYDGLDPSEKSAVSYFVGLTVAKLLAHRLLDVPWLMHLDVYRRDLQPVLHGGGKPDLVGQNGAGQWVAIESKGRTHGQCARLRMFEPSVFEITNFYWPIRLKSISQSKYGKTLREVRYRAHGLHKRSNAVNRPGPVLV
jgi:hypothetical protein